MLDWTYMQKTNNKHNQTVTDLEPTREKKTRKTKKQLEEVHRGRTGGDWILLEATGETSPKQSHIKQSHIEDQSG